jgi:hypothetical protein
MYNKNHLKTSITESIIIGKGGQKYCKLLKLMINKEKIVTWLKSRRGLGKGKKEGSKSKVDKMSKRKCDEEEKRGRTNKTDYKI